MSAKLLLAEDPEVRAQDDVSRLKVLFPHVPDEKVANTYQLALTKIKENAVTNLFLYILAFRKAKTALSEII